MEGSAWGLPEWHRAEEAECPLPLAVDIGKRTRMGAGVDVVGDPERRDPTGVHI